MYCKLHKTVMVNFSQILVINHCSHTKHQFGCTTFGFQSHYLAHFSLLHFQVEQYDIMSQASKMAFHIQRSYNNINQSTCDN